MSKPRTTRSKRTPLYGNCIIQAPDGQVLCRAGNSKIQWYVDRKLGEVISENPTTLRLFFEPKDRAGAEHPYNTAYKENICVVCGVEEITRHHVVPRCFRRYFPSSLKDHSFHDVLILCINCHDKYEAHAYEYKKQIGRDMGIKIGVNGFDLDKSLLKVRTAAHALKMHYDKIPQPRREELLDRLRKFFGRQVITKDDILEADKLVVMRENPEHKPFGKLVVDRLDDLDDFIFKWRKHFVSVMEPKHLPKFWDVANKLK